jgi:hypothetical protein
MSAVEQPAAFGTWTVSETRLGREHLSAAEVFVAIQSLTDEEQTKLLKFAILKSVQTPYDGKDLIQETLTRCLESYSRILVTEGIRRQRLELAI